MRRQEDARSYDVFLSHSHVDQAWVRELHGRLAAADHHGRYLRVWLDQEVLDPGELSSDRELGSALDRSRFLLVVLTPESVASTWVRYELDYFLERSRLDRVIAILRRPCRVPHGVEATQVIEWPEDANNDDQLARLIEILCPAPDDGYDEYGHRRAVRRAWAEARSAIGEGFDPTPIGATNALLDLLLSYDIEDLEAEGPALVGFERAGALMAEVDANEAYGTKMALGEILAVGILRSARYRQVAQRYVAADQRTDQRTEKRPSFSTIRNRSLAGRSGAPSTTNLLFAVARAASKISEIATGGVDLSLLASICHRLDQTGGAAPDERALARMVGRTLGKLRGTRLADTLIHTLVAAGGNGSHLAAASAISAAYGDRDAPVYYTQAMAERAAGRPAPQPDPPGGWIVRLLDYTSPLAAPDHELRADLDVCLQDFRINFGPVADLIGPGPRLQHAPAPTAMANGPLAGTVRRITLANMERYADSLGPTDIACVTEERVVDALFEGASGYLVDHSQLDEPLGNRLRLREARFAAFDRSTLDRFGDDDVLALWPGDARTGHGRWLQARSADDSARLRR